MVAVGIYVYMLRCADGSYYVRSATGHDVSTRVDLHNAGSYPGYTNLLAGELAEKIAEHILRGSQELAPQDDASVFALLT
jgi:predicted GIY-YIG superfamily endonuclease